MITKAFMRKVHLDKHVSINTMEIYYRSNYFSGYVVVIKKLDIYNIHYRVYITW